MIRLEYNIYREVTMSLPDDIKKHAEELRALRQSRKRITSEEAKEQTRRVSRRKVNPHESTKG